MSWQTYRNTPGDYQQYRKPSTLQEDLVQVLNAHNLGRDEFARRCTPEAVARIAIFISATIRQLDGLLSDGVRQTPPLPTVRSGMDMKFLDMDPYADTWL